MSTVSKRISNICSPGRVNINSRLIFLSFFSLALVGCSSGDDEQTIDELETAASTAEVTSTPESSNEPSEEPSNEPSEEPSNGPSEEPQQAAEQPFQPANLPVADDVDLASITDLVLVTGQSNALGTLTAFDASLDQPHNRVYAFTNSGWQIANLEQFWDMNNPGNFSASDPSRDPFNNFAMHFGKTIAENRTDRTVAFVLITAPGQEITHWDADGEFFGQIRNKALTALNQVPHKSSFDGILWHQGESDAGGSEDYTTRLNALINNFRLENWFGFEKPFICGETAGFPVNDRLNMLNTDGDQWTGCVQGAGLPTLDDGIHFSAEGLRKIGEFYAWRFITMRPRP